MKTIQLSNAQILTIMIALKRSEEQHKMSAYKEELLNIRDYCYARAKAESDLYDLFRELEASSPEKESARQFAIKLESRFAYDDDKDTITKKELLDIVKDILKEKENDF